MDDQEIQQETQEECRRLVNREVLLCVSGLAEKMMGHETDLLEHFDNLYVRVCEECGEHLPHDAENDPSDPLDPSGDAAYQCPSCDSYMDLDECDIEPQEVYEWYAVTDWLAKHLAQRGEVVCHDFYNLNLWGRCTTGQAILLDGVIQSIVRELHQRDAKR